MRIFNSFTASSKRTKEELAADDVTFSSKRECQCGSNLDKPERPPIVVMTFVLPFVQGADKRSYSHALSHVSKSRLRRLIFIRYLLATFLHAAQYLHQRRQLKPILSSEVACNIEFHLNDT